MSRPEAPAMPDFLAPYAGLKSRNKIALKMIENGDANLGSLLKLPDNIFTKEMDSLPEEHIRINKIIFYLHRHLGLDEKHASFTREYFVKLVKELIEIDIARTKPGEKPKINFIYKDPTTKEDLLSRAMRKGDLETQEIVIGNHFDGKMILALYSKYKSGALPLIKRLVKKDKEEAALNGSIPKINLNFVDASGDNILLKVIAEDDFTALRFLVRQGVSVDYRRTPKEYTPLMSAIAEGRVDMVKTLMEHGANLDARDRYSQTPLMLALLSNQQDLALMIAGEMRHEISQTNSTGDDAICIAELNSLEKFLAVYLKGDHQEYSIAVNAKKLLDLLYSQDDSPGVSRENIELQRRFFKRHPLGASEQDNPYMIIANEVDKCLDPSSEGKYRIDLGGGKKLEVVKMPIPHHAAFIAVEYQKDGAGNDVAAKLSYCDGNLPLSEVNAEGYAAGEVCFQVQPQLARVEDLGKKVARDFFSNISVIMTKDDEILMGRFEELFARFVETTQSGRPKIIEENIATVAQDRGNCSMKSLNILLRAIRKKLQNLEFEKKDFFGDILHPHGDGYEDFKKYKKFIIYNCLDDILKIAESERVDSKNSICLVVLASLKSSLLQSASKKDYDKLDDSVMLKIINALHVRGLSDKQISEIKSSEGRNILAIAIAEGMVRAVSWCAQNGIDLTYSRNREDLLLKLFNGSPESVEMLASHLRIYHEKQLDPKLAVNLMFAAARSKTKEGEDFMRQMILEDFNLASRNEAGTAFFNYVLNSNPEFLSFLLVETQKHEELRSKMIAVYTEENLVLKLDLEAYRWMAFSAVEFGSNELVLEMIRNGFPLAAQNHLRVSLFDHSFSCSPKLITLLLQEDIITPDEAFLTKTIDKALASIKRYKGYLKEEGKKRSVEEMEDYKMLVEEYEGLVIECHLKSSATKEASDLLVARMTPSLPEFAEKLEKRANEKRLLQQQKDQAAAASEEPASEVALSPEELAIRLAVQKFGTRESLA